MAEVPEPVRAKMRRWKADPVYFVRTELKAEPDPAQIELLEAFADPTIQRIGLKASKGTAKTAGLVFCNLNFIATRKRPKMAALSISWDNLMDNFWTELAKWYVNSKYLKHKFRWTKSSFYAVDHPETWWISARSWAKTADSTQQAKTLAGLHEDNTLVTLDESGGMFQSVMDAADGTLATVGGEHRILQGGNPTNLDGPLYKADTTDRHIWKMIAVTGDPDNPTRSPRVSMDWARQQIHSYGRDHDWVKVNVLGEFPSGSFNRFLSPDDVQKSMGRHLQETLFNNQAKILGVDPGRFGGDRTVLFPRQGMAAFTPVVLRPNRSEKNWTGNVAARICRAFEKWGADACFIDDSGGWGSGILDAVRDAGWNIQGVQFGGTALDPRYKNRRCEMHMLASEWVKDGGALPFMPEIQREACASEYWFTGSKFVMEEKDQVKIKLNGDSPDLWDSFCLTFAMPVAPRTGLPWLDAGTLRAKIEDDEDRYDSIQRARMDQD
jgi:phage terminase large subunit